MVNQEQEKKTNGLRIEFEIFGVEKLVIYLCFLRLSLFGFSMNTRDLARESLSLSLSKIFHLHPLESFQWLYENTESMAWLFLV